MLTKKNLLPLLGATIAASCALPAHQAFAQYSAIATDKQTGAWGAGWDYDNPDDAEVRALDECNGDCSIDVTVYNGCGAVAHGSDGQTAWVGAAYDADRDTAASLADEACDAKSGDLCEVVVSNCSWVK